MTAHARRRDLGLRPLRRPGLVSRRTVVVLVVAVLGVLGAWWMPRPIVMWSPSPSLPVGYYVRDFSRRSWQVGDLVVLETPAVLKSSLPQGYGDKPLLKEIAALPGMRVCWEEASMVVEHPTG